MEAQKAVRFVWMGNVNCFLCEAVFVAFQLWSFDFVNLKSSPTMLLLKNLCVHISIISAISSSHETPGPEANHTLRKVHTCIYYSLFQNTRLASHAIQFVLRPIRHVSKVQLRTCLS